MREDIIVEPNMTLAKYLSKLQNNFIEIYSFLVAGEGNYIGLPSSVLTSGVLSDERIDSNIVRKDYIDSIPDLTLLFNNKLL